MGLFSKLFGKNKKTETPAKTADEVYYTLHVNARLQPLQRGEYFEDPFGDILRQLKIGDVSGGGTLVDNNGGGPISCDIDIDCIRGEEERLIKVVSECPFLPKGSSLVCTGEDKPELPVGTIEGMALYLNGVDLPKETYEKYPIDPFCEKLSELMGDDLILFDFWKGPREMCLYFYGSSFERMKAATAEFIKSCPLCEKSRVEQLC